MAHNPDPSVTLTTLRGSTRTIDDWATMFHLVLAVLPDRPEAARFLGPVRKVFRVFGDADCRTAIVIPSTKGIAERILRDETKRTLVFVDPEKAFVDSLGLERLPALVHLRQDTTLVDAAEGWSPEQWQRVCGGIAEAMAWSEPDLRSVTDPPPTAGWPTRSAA